MPLSPEEIAAANSVNEKLLAQFGDPDATATETTETETQVESTEAGQQAAVEAQASDLRSILQQEGLDLSDLDDKAVASSLKQKLAEVAELRKQVLEAEEAKQRLAQYEGYYQQQQLLAQQQQAPQQQEQASTEAKEAIRKWKEVKIDPALAALCDRDANGMYTPKQSFGPTAMTAAAELNNAIRERDRRADLILNDPIAALNEAGYDDIIRSQIERTVTSKIEELTAAQRAQYEQHQQAYAQQMRETQMNVEAEKFYQDTKSQLFKLDANGDPSLNPLTGKAVLTELGNKVAQLSSQLMADGMAQDQALKRAYALMKDLSASAPPPPTPEEKKKEFLNRGRVNSQAQVSRPAPIQQPQDVPFIPNLREMILTDPDNAEVLGELYRGN